jgi:hypothetical protein
MGPGDLIPEYVEDRTGSPALGFAAGFVNPAGMLRKKPPMKQDIFIGDKAKTWDATRAQAAQDLLRKGVNPHAKTGVHAGAEGKLRQEIDDSTSKWLADDTKLKQFMDTDVPLPMREVLDHPELYKAYPEIADMPVRFRAGGSSAFKPEKDMFTIGADSNADLRSPLLHEVQHKIQELQRWGKGGNPGMFKSGGVVTPEDEFNAMMQYKNLAGEVESRLVQDRLRMSKQHRGFADPVQHMESSGYPINNQTLYEVERSVPPPGSINQPQFKGKK